MDASHLDAKHTYLFVILADFMFCCASLHFGLPVDIPTLLSSVQKIVKVEFVYVAAVSTTYLCIRCEPT
jgi:hypothetical protein